MISEEQFKAMMSKLDTLIKITASNVFQGKPLVDSIIFLSNLGIGNTEIANILGTTAPYVNKVKYETKKGKRKKNKNELKAEEGGKQSDKN